MTRQRRDPWFELELRDDPDDVRVLFRPGWTNDTEGMFLPLRETGWFATTFETRRALEGVTLTWGWIGVDDDLNLVAEGPDLVVRQPAVSVHPDAEMSKVCPALSGDLRGLYITATRPRPAEDLAFPTGTMQFLISIAYPDKMMDFDPNQRYFIARIEFDHSTSVEGEGVPGTSRGGFEQPIQFRLNGKRCTFLAIDGMTEYPFDVSNGAVLATFGGSPSLTPAAATTWGQIKSQYRR